MPKIEFNQAFDADFSKRVQQLEKDLESFLKTFKEVGKTARATAKDLKTVKSFNELTKATKKAAAEVNKLTAEEKKFERIQKALTFELSDAGKKYAKLNEEKKQASKRNRDLAVSQDKGRKSTNKWTKALGSFAFKFNALGNIAANAVKKIVSQLGQAIKETVRMAGEFQGVVAAFKQIDNYAKVLDDITKATRGTVSQMGLMQNALKAENFKIPMDVLAKGLEFATKRASQTGESVDYLVESFTVGLGRQSIKILDNLGISAIELRDEVALTGDFMKAVGNITDRELTKMGAVILTDAQKMDKFKASIQNVQIGFGQLVLKGFSPFINVGNKILDNANRQSKALTTERTKLNALIGVATSATISEEARLRVIKDMQREYPDFLGNISAENVKNEDLIKSLKETNLQYKEKIKLAILQEALADEQGKLNKKIGQEIRLTTELNSAKVSQKIAQDRYNEAVKNGSPTVNTYLQNLSDWNTRVENLNERLGRNSEGQEKWQSTIARTTSVIEAQMKAMDGEAAGSEVVTEETDAQRKARKNLNEAYALSVELLGKIKPPQDVEDMIQAETEAAAKFAKLVAGEGVDLGEGFWDEWLGGFDESSDGAIEAAEAMNEKLFQISEAQRNREKEANAKATEERIATEQSMINSINGLVTESFNVFSNLNQRKQDALDARLDKGLISEGNYDKQINALRKKQDTIQKAQAIFSIGINTAVAAMQVAGQTGVGAAVAVPLVIALGAAQIAAVLSEPVPKYAEGVKSSPAGPAIVGEKGPELMIYKGNVGLTPSEPTLMNLKRGTEIVPADISNELLKYSYIKTAMPNESDDTVLRMMEEIKGLRRDMKVKPVASSTLTPAGIFTATHRGNTTIKDLKKYFL